MNPSTYSIPLDIQRISSDILDLGVASFLDLAIIAPDIWHRLSDPDERRQVAELLGWPTVCIQDLFEAMTLTDFVTVFFNAGIKTIEDLWQRFPYACDYLRKTGRIDSIIRLLKLAPERTVFPDDLAFFLERCRNAGSFEVWRDIDRKAFQSALGLCLVDDIARQVPHRLLFDVAAETLATIAADPKHLGAQIGATLVLHTWGSALTHHPHVHGIVPGGGLSVDGERWVACRRGFFLPVRVLSRLFRRRFLEELEKRHHSAA